VRLEDDSSLLQDLDSGSVISEWHYKKKTGRDPPPLGTQEGTEVDYDGDVLQECPRKKQKTNASASIEVTTTTDHFLVGKKFCLTWTDLKDQTKVVYGEVIECEKNTFDGDIYRFKVKYSSQSRAIVNSINNCCASIVPETQMLPASLVLGGCIRLGQQLNVTHESALLNGLGREMHRWNWITPEMRHREMVENHKGKRLPCLTIVLRGFKLELTVEPSTIPNAGNGVFLRCSRVMADAGAAPSEPFILKAGELVDLDCYAPFGPQDKKLEAVMIIKNFLHSHKCEEWAFDALQSHYQLDITDDVTGDIHAEAMSHIPAYVNESDADGAVCIRAEHDAEGSVHYLLGHPHKAQGSFVMPSDGITKREVYVNYGNIYEKIRVRKQYGFLPGERAHLLKIIENEDTTSVLEMDAFSPVDLEASVDFLLGLFSKDANFSKDVAQRALVCAVVLQRRAQKLFLKGFLGVTNANDDATVDMSNAVDLRKVLKLSEKLVVLLLGMVPDKEDRLKVLQAANSVDNMCVQVLKMQFSNKELSKLSQMME